jgi:predicted negative regulator of RcsB-dependent stress response
MAYDLEEQEQLAQMRVWWNKYGMSVLSFLGVILLTVLSWQGWSAYQTNQAKQARGYFDAVELASQQPSADSAARLLAAMQTLRKDFGTTDYAARAALFAASSFESQQNIPAAQDQLEWLVKSQHAAIVPVAQLRLAGLFLDQKKYDQALSLLSNPPVPFEALFLDRRGDIYAAQGNAEQAKQAWAKTLTLIGLDNALAPVVQLKLDSLGR